jgi:hypothetical protein
MTMVAAGAGDGASTPAQTGVATYVKSTMAQLNGTIRPDGLDSFWAFQYGTSATAYGHNTPAVGPVSGTAAESVATLVRGLAPGTTYHFRLVAIRGQAGASGDAQGYTGADASFTTPSSSAGSTNSTRARATLRSRTLTVRHGAAVMTWGCSGSGGAMCKGRVSLAARGKRGTVSCGGGAVRLATGKHGTVRAPLGKTCLPLLTSALRHRLGASLKASFSAGSGPSMTRVTLVLP